MLLSAAVKDKRFKALVLVGASPCFVGNESFPYGHPSALVKRMIEDMGSMPDRAIDRFLKLNFTHEELLTDEAVAFIETYGCPKQVASEAILAAGGTISHHHGIGVDHLAWMARERGALGMDALRAAKAVVDPDGLMNPGKLL